MTFGEYIVRSYEEVFNVFLFGRSGKLKLPVITVSLSLIAGGLQYDSL